MDTNTKLILITGGARSGKSTYAENLARELSAMNGNSVIYAATAVAFDDEMRQRIERHRQSRPETWQTVEGYRNLDSLIREACNTCKTCGGTDGVVVLLDCVTVMIGNLMMESNVDWDNDQLVQVKKEEAAAIEADVLQEVDHLLQIIGDGRSSAHVTLIAVTNEVGMGIVPDKPMARLFRDIAGRVNQKLAASADEVVLCVSGIPVKIKG